VEELLREILAELRILNARLARGEADQISAAVEGLEYPHRPRPSLKLHRTIPESALPGLPVTTSQPYDPPPGRPDEDESYGPYEPEGA
jgi:hypothetical protein